MNFVQSYITIKQMMQSKKGLSQKHGKTAKVLHIIFVYYFRKLAMMYTAFINHARGEKNNKKQQLILVSALHAKILYYTNAYPRQIYGHKNPDNRICMLQCA